MKTPESVGHWTTLYYGSKGSGKSLHSAREMLVVLRYLQKLYNKYPRLRRAIVITNHKVSPELEKLYLGREIFYFDDTNFESLHFCPRLHCWRGSKPHTIHGAYLFIDDISNMLPATDWARVELWLKKLMIKGRKFGVHIVATCIDPFDVVLPIRRATDICFKFRSMWKTRDPDETRPPLKWVFGWYKRRKISADMLWKFGDLPEQMIQLRMIDKEDLHERLKEMDKAYAIVYDDTWKGSVHMFNRKGRFCGLKISSTETYDTLQDIAPD